MCEKIFVFFCFLCFPVGLVVTSLITATFLYLYQYRIIALDILYRNLMYIYIYMCWYVIVYCIFIPAVAKMHPGITRVTWRLWHEHQWHCGKSWFGQHWLAIRKSITGTCALNYWQMKYCKCTVEPCCVPVFSLASLSLQVFWKFAPLS